MKCFYHEQVNAVTSCHACHRGLCRDCAVDVGCTTSCRDRCEDEVASHVVILEQTRKAYAMNTASFKVAAVLLFMPGAASVLFGVLYFLQSNGFYAGLFCTGFGLTLIWAGISFYRAALEFGDTHPSGSDRK